MPGIKYNIMYPLCDESHNYNGHNATHFDVHTLHPHAKRETFDIVG